MTDQLSMTYQSHGNVMTIYSGTELLAKSDPHCMKCYCVLTLHSGRGSMVAWHNLCNFWKVMTVYKEPIPSEINTRLLKCMVMMYTCSDDLVKVTGKEFH